MKKKRKETKVENENESKQQTTKPLLKYLKRELNKLN